MIQLLMLILIHNIFHNLQFYSNFIQFLLGTCYVLCDREYEYMVPLQRTSKFHGVVWQEVPVFATHTQKKHAKAYHIAWHSVYNQ